MNSHKLEFRALIRLVCATSLALCSVSCAVGPQFHKPQAPANAGYSPEPMAPESASAPVHGGEA